MPTTTLFRRITSTRYIFLLPGLVFVLWSLATSLAPKSSILSALTQMDLDKNTTRSITAQQHTEVMDPGSSDLTLKLPSPIGVGIAHSHIYMISLADRQDRREQMELLRIIQDLTWTIVDAVPANTTITDRILRRVALHRAESKRPSSSRFRWPEGIDALSVSQDALNLLGSDTWSSEPASSKFQVDPSTYASLVCATEDDSIPTFADDTPDWMVLSPAKVACWHSHVSAIRRFVDGRDSQDHLGWEDVAVILEDDIDMEKDISTRLSQVWTFLPPGWDIVFLGTYVIISRTQARRSALNCIATCQGHCWSDEAYYPSLTAFTNTNLYPSRSPKCTHAYALSRPGARRLLQHLRYPPFAYSRALDQAYAWLVRSGRLRSYSIVPSLVVQRKSGRSDISPGAGSEWREGLRNGVFQT